MMPKKKNYTARINKNIGWYHGAIYINGILKERTAGVRNKVIAIRLLNKRIKRLNLCLEEKIPEMEV
ncbi:Uncharacterised protein [Pasteurella multocida]|nr:Uncharacterised protein [Pasteurella multocida]